jgi:hypothetical protein
MTIALYFTAKVSLDVNPNLFTAARNTIIILPSPRHTARYPKYLLANAVERAGEMREQFCSPLVSHDSRKLLLVISV